MILVKTLSRYFVLHWFLKRGFKLYESWQSGQNNSKPSLYQRVSYKGGKNNKKKNRVQTIQNITTVLRYKSLQWCSNWFLSALVIWNYFRFTKNFQFSSQNRILNYEVNLDWTKCLIESSHCTLSLPKCFLVFFQLTIFFLQYKTW